MTELFEADPVVGWAVIGLVALLGLVIGSFLNVVIWRVPRGESLNRPPSACPKCQQPIGARDNIPVFSWLLLRGKCRACGAPISKRYPAVELTTAVLFVATALHFGITVEFVALGYLAAIGVALFLIDLDVKRLPNAIVLPAYIVLPALLTLATWINGDWNALLRAAIGGVILYVFYFLAMLLYAGGMGFGDVKLAGVLGFALAWLGWGPFVVGAFSAFLLGGLFAVVLLLFRLVGRKSGIPFGPWMLLGAVVGIVVGEPLWSAYLGLMA